MLFPEEEAPLLKQWIVKRLENTSDADADVLADYVLALLRHEGDVATVRELCEREIPDFLKEDTASFVNDVFQAIHYNSYLPGAPSPPGLALPFINPGMRAPTGPANGSRKRSYHERGDWDAPDSASQAAFGDRNGRASKQMRRGGAGVGRGIHNIGRGGNHRSTQPSIELQGQSSAPSNANEMAWNIADAAGQLALLQQMINFPLPSSSSFPPGSAPPTGSVMAPKKQRCSDYDTKGFCARGNTCIYEHGENSIWVPPQQEVEEYDPSISLFTGTGSSQSTNIPNVQPRGGFRGRARASYDRRHKAQASSNRRGGRSESSSDRPNYDDKSNKTIVVENIPEEAFSEDKVRDFFSEFGSILGVSMRPYKRLAIVEYDDWNSALAAYKSPKVIFDNRFVKVYWYMDQNSSSKPPGVGPPQAIDSSTPRPGSEHHMDTADFARKQAEAQNIYEEKTKKKQAMEAAKKDLERRQEELLKTQAKEKRRLMERIAARTEKPMVSAAGLDDEVARLPASESVTQTDALKAKLAALEAEAQELGIDTSISSDSASWPGGDRGRGRGLYRGRSAYAPRGYRGGSVGRGASRFVAAPGRSFSLDNRPRGVGITGVDFTDLGKDESLRQYLLGIGEYTNIEVTPSRTTITFKDRHTAEKFMFGLPGGDIPSVGRVELAWVHTPLPRVGQPTVDQVVDQSTGKDAMESDGDAMLATETNLTKHDRASHEEQHVPRQDANLDYDVADENDWGPD